jgi:hypothetical protein
LVSNIPNKNARMGYWMLWMVSKLYLVDKETEDITGFEC